MISRLNERVARAMTEWLVGWMFRRAVLAIGFTQASVTDIDRSSTFSPVLRLSDEKFLLNAIQRRDEKHFDFDLTDST